MKRFFKVTKNRGFYHKVINILSKTTGVRILFTSTFKTFCKIALLFIGHWYNQLMNKHDFLRVECFANNELHCMSFMLRAVQNTALLVKRVPKL